MTDETPPQYQGQSMAIHSDTWDSAVDTEGPPTDVPVLPGKALKITSHADSPAQWMDETVMPPLFDVPSYWARSKAIHVYGTPATGTPPPPIPSCRCCAEAGDTEAIVAVDVDVYSGYTMRRVLSATEMGGTTSIVSDGFFHAASALRARWDSYDITSGGDQGGQELEDRDFVNYLVPDGTTKLRIHGTITASLPVSDPETNGRPVDTVVRVEIRSVAYDPDTEPAFDLTGSLVATLSTTVTGTTPSDTQVPTSVEIDCANIGPIFDIGDSNVWRLVQLVAICVSTDGIGRHTWFAAPGHADATQIEIVDRFPNNPNWHRSGHPLGDYVDMTQVQSGITSSLTADAYANVVTTCDLTDHFGRTTSNGLGGDWDVYLGSASQFSTDGSQAVITTVSPFEAGAEVIPVSVHDDVTVTARVTGSSSSSNRCFLAAEPADFTDSVYLEVATNGHVLASTNTTSTTTTVAWSTANPFRMRIRMFGGNAEFYVWPLTDPMPSSPTLTLAYPGTPTFDGDIDIGAFGDVTAYFDDFGCTPISSALGVQGDCADGAPCAECNDPNNPGFQLPPFTPGFMPTFRRQIGDPTTSLDSFLCTLESAAMVLDWHTRGAISVWGGQLVPWCGKTEAQIRASGTNLGNAAQAWAHYGQHLEVRSGQTFTDMMACLAEGRAVILQGDYGQLSTAERCQINFEAGHAISVYPYQIGDRLLRGDPLCHNFNEIKISTLQAYAEALTGGGPGILFAVSRPWTP